MVAINLGFLDGTTSVDDPHGPAKSAALAFAAIFAIGFCIFLIFYCSDNPSRHGQPRFLRIMARVRRAFTKPSQRAEQPIELGTLPPPSSDPSHQTHVAREPSPEPPMEIIRPQPQILPTLPPRPLFYPPGPARQLPSPYPSDGAEIVMESRELSSRVRGFRRGPQGGPIRSAVPITRPTLHREDAGIDLSDLEEISLGPPAYTNFGAPDVKQPATL